MNDVQSHAFTLTHAIFSLAVLLLHALFSITGLLGVQLSHAWQVLRAISHVPEFVWIFLVNKKLDSLISCFLSRNMYAWHDMSQRGLIFYGCAAVSRLFLFLLGQLNTEFSETVAFHINDRRFFFKVCVEIPLDDISTCFIDFTQIVLTSAIYKYSKPFRGVQYVFWKSIRNLWKIPIEELIF